MPKNSLILCSISVLKSRRSISSITPDSCRMVSGGHHNATEVKVQVKVRVGCSTSTIGLPMPRPCSLSCSQTANSMRTVTTERSWSRGILLRGNKNQNQGLYTQYRCLNMPMKCGEYSPPSIMWLYQYTSFMIGLPALCRRNIWGDRHHSGSERIHREPVVACPIRP